MNAVALASWALPAPAAAAARVSFRHPVLAWAAAGRDEARFRGIARRCLLVALLFALALPWWPRPDPVRIPAAPLPAPVARLLLERESPPRPLPPPARAVPAPVNEAEPRAPRAPVAVPEARRPLPQRAPGERDDTRRVASGVGLLALKQQLAEIHGAPVAVQMTVPKPGAGVGSGQGVGVGAGADSGLPTRALITAGAAQGSGGIDTSGFSRDAGGGGLAGRATTLVAGVAGGAGGGGPGGGGVGVPGARGDAAAARSPTPGSGPARGATGSGRASRSIEDIKLVFDRNKGAIYALYNRALRDEPGLQGKVVLELKIAPSGQVVEGRIVASELHAAELERKLLARVRQFDFGAKDVEPMVVSWPVDFLPS